MKSCKKQFGVTLVEILTVVAITAILVTIVISVATRIHAASQEQLVENTFGLLNAALGQFKDYGYNYDSASDYTEFDFPLDCNDFDETDLQTTLENALGLDSGDVLIYPAVSYDLNYSGSEVLYFFLSRVPESRETLDKIDSSLITSTGTITVDGRDYPLLRIIDPWGRTLRYDYYDEAYSDPDPDEARNFPLITSAGPDRRFGTDDDITNR